MTDPDQDLGCQEFTLNTDYKFETFELNSFKKKQDNVQNFKIKEYASRLDAFLHIL
jgi:hypothetical protein